MAERGASGAVYEVPVSGAFDEEAANAAGAVGFHLAGSAPPIVLVRTWGNEIPKHRALAQDLGFDQPLYSIAPPSGRKVEDYPGSVDAWSDFCLERFLPLDLESPYRLGGWSFGGVVALDMAEKLLARGEPTALLLFLDTRIPTYHAKARRGRRASGLHKFAKRLNEYAELRTREQRRAYLRRRSARWLGKNAKKLRKLTGREKERVFENEAKLAQGEGEIVRSPTGRPMGLLERTIRVTYLKYEKRPTSIPIAQFWTRESLGEERGDATLGWGRYARGPFESVGIPGSHHGMWEDENRPLLAAHLRRALVRMAHVPPVEVPQAHTGPAPAPAARAD